MKRVLLACLLALLPLLVQAGPIRIGSKQFTESVILGELARVSAREAGVAAIHQRDYTGPSAWRRLLTRYIRHS